MSPVACCSNDEEVRKHPQDNSSSKQAVKTDLQCTESEMVFHYNSINDECMKYDNSPTDSFRPVSAKVRQNENVKNLHGCKE